MVRFLCSFFFTAIVFFRPEAVAFIQLPTCTSTDRDNPTDFKTTPLFLSADGDSSKEDDALKAVIDAMYGGKPLSGESPDATRSRIEALVNDHSVLLFMKGSKSFPQCGFSDTATKILKTFDGVEYHTVDVLSDEAIRQGIKDYSQWPTIPQLYIKGAFIGGSDIMMEMYQSGELATLLSPVSGD